MVEVLYSPIASRTTITASVKENLLDFEVKDTGIGMKENIINDIFNIAVDYQTLQATHQTTQQKMLNKQQRLLNVEASYALTRPLTATHIALIDDVITTGATTKALAYLLREHGASHIQAWSIARTV